MNFQTRRFLGSEVHVLEGHRDSPLFFAAEILKASGCPFPSQTITNFHTVSGKKLRYEELRHQIPNAVSKRGDSWLFNAKRMLELLSHTRCGTYNEFSEFLK